MKWLRPHRPSPALVISLIALFVALGGTGYAASQLAKNSVGTKQLKNNAVTSAKVKNNSLTGADVKNGSLTGADIKLGSLGAVPTANNASHAGVADNASHANAADTANAVNYEKTFDFTIASNAPNGTDFLTIGQFTMTALCDINNAGNDNAQLLIRSSVNHAAFDASPENNDMAAGTEYNFRQSTATTPTTNIEYSSTLGGAVGTDGKGFWGFFPINVNPPGQPGKCQFQGRYIPFG